VSRERRRRDDRPVDRRSERSSYEKRDWPKLDRPEEERFVAVWDGTRWVQEPV
jgi:hypothetical protein